MSKHTHYCPKCDTDSACDHDCPNEPHVGALYNLGNAVECAMCAARDPRLVQLETERLALDVLVQRTATQARRNIIASLAELDDIRGKLEAGETAKVAGVDFCRECTRLRGELAELSAAATKDHIEWTIDRRKLRDVSDGLRAELSQKQTPPAPILSALKEMKSITPEALELCARAAHEANRAYCLALGDTSQLAWDDAPDWQRLSAYQGVRRVVLEDATPEQLHESWTALKLAAGWKHGPVKDSEKLEHPCMVPYSELPEQQRRKDALFGGVVRAMAAALLGQGVTQVQP